MSALVETRSLRMRETGGANSQNHCHCAPLVIQLVTCGLKGPTKPSWSDPASEVIVSWSSCLQSPVGGRRRDHVVHRAPKLTRRAGPPLFDLSQGTFALCLLWTRRVPAAQLPELPGFDQSAGHGYGPSGGFGLVDVTKTARRTSVPERTFFGEEVGKRFLQCLALLSEPGSQSQSERKHVRSDVAAAWRWRSPAGLPRSEFDVRRCSCRPHTKWSMPASMSHCPALTRQCASMLLFASCQAARGLLLLVPISTSCRAAPRKAALCRSRLVSR